MENRNKLKSKLDILIPSDRSRITEVSNQLFYIIGFKKNTINDIHEGFWVKDDEIIHFDYFNEKIIASGYNDNELIESVKEYIRLSAITWEEYFKDLSKERLTKKIKF